LGDISDKNERMEKAYGNVSTADYEEAGKSLEKAQALDKDKVYQMEMAMAGMGMMGEINNLAVGKYQAKKYDEAMEFFEGNYEISKAMGKKDTSNIFNAMISAQKANNYEKTKYYADKMISDKVANASAYQFLFDANIALKDTNAAKAALSKGRAAFPNNTYLMNRETEFYLQSGKQEEALANLNSSILKDPSNSQLYLVRGNVYDNLANPKDANRKDLEKPKNYEELVGKAEADYLKSSELNGALFDTWYNLGALYNNWGAYYQAKADAISKSGPEQKAFQTKADTYFGKAIPQLEKALELNSKDKATMFALRKLYMLTNQPDKAAKMSEAMKK
jgi:tetratricopeptide (TPR) repeat protein